MKYSNYDPPRAFSIYCLKVSGYDNLLPLIYLSDRSRNEGMLFLIVLPYINILYESKQVTNRWYTRV